jgi:putative transposase
MIYAEGREAVAQARRGFARKWKLRCQAVYQSLEEVGDDLFTFTAFPAAQWRLMGVIAC